MKVKFNILKQTDLCISDIDCSKYRIRKNIGDSIKAEFVHSVKAIGIIHQLIVENIAGKHYLVSGFRRLEAAKKAGCENVPCLIIEGLLAPIIGFLENCHRKKLHPIEKADAISQFISVHGYTQKEVAKITGYSVQTISDEIKISSLPETIKRDALANNNFAKRNLIIIARIKDKDLQLKTYNNLKEKKVNPGRSKTHDSDDTTPTISKAELVIQRIKKITASLEELENKSISNKEMKQLTLALKNLNYATKKLSSKSDTSDFFKKLLSFFNIEI